MDSNDNVTGAIPQSGTLGSPKRTWKDFSPPTSVRGDSSTMAESGNANSKTSTLLADVGGGGDDGGGADITNGTVKLEQKVQIVDGPVIRMGMGALTSRRDVRNHPDSLPMKVQGVMATWKDVSPPKEKRNLLESSQKEKRGDGGKVEDGVCEEKNRNPIRTNPFHEAVGTYRGTDGNFQSVKRVKTDVAETTSSSGGQSSSCSETTAAIVAESAVALTTWRDVSPTKPQDGRKKRPESGYFSNDVQSEGGQESREEIDSSLSDSDCVRRDRSHSSGGGGEEGCFHSSDYFYEDEFSVQFDTNLREAVAGGEQEAQEEEVILPESLNGSYTKFRDSLLQTDLYLGPYESELSGSRTSMEISSSEREMMCSSDMLNFSNDPLFTPSPPPGEQQQVEQQNVSVDSLSHQGHGAEMGYSRSSNDPNIGVDCCIRKDAYFLSFNGSQHRSTSESDISCVSQVSSQEGDQGEGGSQTDSSQGQDAEDEGSNSYNFQDDNGDDKSPTKQQNPSPTPFCRPVRNMLLSRYPGRVCLEALQDYLLSRSSSSKSPGSSRHSCSSHCKMSPLGGTLLSSGDLFASTGHRRGLRRSTNLTTWKQVKNLKKLGREKNIHERSNSMPNLTAEDVKVVRREGPHRNVESMADSFHKKRHSAYILELYQRLMMSSNPPSPTTLSRIDKVLFHEGFGQENPSQDVSDQKDCVTSCPSCGARGGKRDLHLDLRRDAQCGRSQCSATTSVSPQTLTLWYGQKNFSSQFPPNTADCGVQASIGEDGPSINNRSMQTSPGSPGADILNVLQELQAKELRESRNQKREKAPMTRAKSATECRDTHAERLKAQMRRTVSLSPSRIGMNSFYTHQSLPDLSFLSGSSKPLSKSRDSSSSAISLFDPVQIPIILTPVVEDGTRSGHSQSRSSTSSGCGCGKEQPQNAAPSRRRRQSSSGRSGEFTSSGSNFSLSSASSGIEAGYVEPRSLPGLAPELEHLLFYPPHLESAYHQLGLSETTSRVGQQSDGKNEEGNQAETDSASPTKRCSTAKIDRYANETHPSAAQGPRVVKQNQRRNSNAGSSTGSLNPDRLDALKEEKTPSPEPSYCHYPPRDYTDHHCFGCHDMSEGESSQEMDEEKFMMYQRWLQERKPPLKSCLRKRCDRDHRARSLSNFSYVEKPEAPPEKPPRKQNRHSIACDGMMPVLVDEDGFECNSLAPCPPYPPPPPPLCNHPPLVQEYGGEKVVLRRKKPAPTISEGAGDASIEDSMRAKRVSFASEVSFHSPNYTPQCSPRRQPEEKEITAVQMEDDILTLHVVRRNRGLPHCVDPDKEPKAAWEDVKTPSSTDPCATLGLSPLDQKAYVVRGVIQAAEALIQHFAQARDPFDKVRLGSSQESAEVGSLVVTSLCPAIERVVRDGMKSCLTGLHIFGKIQLSPWRVTESSAEIGPYTRAINELVKQLKVRPNLVSHRQKFYAFLAGLLNLRLLDFWMGYISTKETITSRFYDDGAILRLSQTSLERQYQDMLLALQPLAVLPFQVDYEIVASYSLADSSYMGESDIDPTSSSPKKQELSSSPKIVVARAKTQAGASPNRASWAGPTDRQDTSFTDRVDFSATWDWIKTTTLPKARSLMSDMGLMSSTTSVTSTTSTAGSVSNTTVKTSRLSQDLASIGIVSSRQNLSVTASSSTPDLPQMCSEASKKEEKEEETRPSSFPGDKFQHPLPAVVVDHGTKRKVDTSSARQKAEDILRRKSEMSPQRQYTQGSPFKAEALEKKEMPNNATRESPLMTQANVSRDLRGNLSSSPQKIVACSPQRRSESSPIRIQNSPVLHSGSPSRQSSSPNRQSGSPNRQSGSPSRQSGSPSRGPLINPGSPKSTISGTKENEGVEGINRRAAKVTLDDFPEDDDDDNNSKPGNPSASPFPMTAVSSAAQKLLPKKEEKVYREGKTDYAFDTTAQSPQDVNPPPATCASPAAQASSPPNANSNQTTGRSRLSGLKRLSPRGSFNIISFFDRLLLPAEKSASNGSASPATKNAVAPQKDNSASEWDSTEQDSSVATGTSSTTSSSAPSPTPPVSLHSSSSTSNNSSPRAHVPKSQSRNSLSRGSRIPKRQVEPSAAKKIENNPQQKTNIKTDKKTATTNMTRRSGANQTTEPIPVSTRQRSDRSETPEVDINANSPEFNPSEPEEMFVEHNPIGNWGGSSSETGQSDGSAQSVSMEEDQTRRVLQAKSGGGGLMKVPAYKYVRTLVSCHSEESDLLTYRPGDRLQVLAEVTDDWLFCTNGPREGFVRTAAVMPLANQREF